MKKVLLTAMALLTIASASAFGMYGDRDSWIDFLVHGNQFRARMDQLGFTLGNGTIKGTFGFRSQAATTYLGNILFGGTGAVDLTTTISGGVGYTSEPFGIGVGYSYTHLNDRLGVHTPVLMINALNNNLRIAVPIQIATSSNPFDNELDLNTEKDYMGVSTDIQIRYYTGIDAFNAIRVYFRYGQAGYKNEIAGSTTDYFAQSIGFQTRFYFLNTTIGNVGINPYLKVEFDTALVGNATTVRAGEAALSQANFVVNSGAGKHEWEKNPYKVTAAAVLGITANSDIVSLYVEPSLGYTAYAGGKQKDVIADDPTVTHKLYWGAYTELYIRPVQDLEWYFEMDVNNNSESGPAGTYNNVPVNFVASTGITWYLPALN